MDMASWNISTIIAFLALFGLVSGQTLPAEAGTDAVVRIGGVGTALTTMQKIARAYEKTHKGSKVEVVPNLGSTGGIKGVIDGALDIGLSGRPLTQEEKARGLAEQEYAMTPFVFVSNNRSAQGLTVGELVAIYGGKKTAWPDGSRIRLVLRPEKDSDTMLLRGISPEMDRAVKAAHSRPGMIMAITDQECISTISRTPDSFGSTTLAQVVSEGHSLNVLPLDGIRPSLKTASSGKYPFTKRLLIIAMTPPRPEARDFISYIFSEQGRRILSRNGNIPADGR